MFSMDLAHSDAIGAAYWLCFGVTAASSLISLGFSLAALMAPTGKDIYARYAASRSVALVAAVILSAFLSSVPVVFVLAIVMTVVQVLDAVIGVQQRDLRKTIGPVVLAVLTLVTAIILGP
jgi:hypothetical protein